MEVRKNAESDHRKTDAEFFGLYDRYGADVYREICKWVEDKFLAKEILFKSFLQIHRQLDDVQNQPVQLSAMLEISHSVCRDFTQELYGERRCC